MEPAIDVMSRALQGDHRARSFLERTTTIYALDVTDASNAKTYGCWNFIHQAMNEIERYELANDPFTPSSLVAHAQLLSTMALRVARRSPAKDRAMVATCISNDSHGNLSPEQSQWLLDLNFELREIVMGRIAAMAFDFSFHQSSVGRHGNSSFADHVVMDTFCAVLSANAVTSGPHAIRHFSTEWIIPSSGNLPPFALASVVFHLAIESQRKLAPAGTKDTLQQLSSPIICIVLIPILAATLSEDEEIIASSRDSERIATKCLCALKAWCNATDLSLPQISHVSLKFGSKIVDLLSDIMYSDSDFVVDALAELIEVVVPLSDEKVMSEGRMSQVRHILQVDDLEFRRKFSPEQLKLIEFREMGAIVNELVSAVSLQRFRFVERQNNDEHGVCRNLARIAATVCSTHIDVMTRKESVELDKGVLTLLLKAAAHPSVNVCAIVLPVLTKCVSIMSLLGPELLPILQRRAIIPHTLTSNLISFAVPGFCDINYFEFLRFRDDVLRKALIACWNANRSYYVESCASAVEEFCSITSSVEVSLQLEAALFCIEIIGPEATHVGEAFPHGDQLSQIISALVLKPSSLMLNPLTLARAYRMMKTYSEWCLAAEKDSIGFELCVAGFTEISSRINLSSDLVEYSPSVSTEAASCLKDFISGHPLHYASDTFAAALRACWYAAQPTIERTGAFSTEARLTLGAGLMQIFQMMPREHQPRLLEELATSSIARLNQASQFFASMDRNTFLSAQVHNVADDIVLLSGLTKDFLLSTSATNNEDMADDHKTLSSQDNATNVVMASHVVSLIRSSLPAVLFLTKALLRDETVVAAVKTFVSDLVPFSSKWGESSLLLDFLLSIDDLCLVSEDHFHKCSLIGHILQEITKRIGEDLENHCIGINSSQAFSEINRCFENKVLIYIGLLNVTEFSDHKSQMDECETAFDSPVPSIKRPEKVDEETSALFLDFLTVLLQFCPSFTIRLKTEQGGVGGGDLIANLAVDAAAKSMTVDDVGSIKSAIRFLLCLLHSTQASDENLVAFATQALVHVRRNTVVAMLAGACGKFDVSLLPDVADLLISTLKCTPLEEIESHLVSALRQDFFICDTFFFTKCVHHGWHKDGVQNFFHELWDMHQAEDVDSLHSSDLVARFVTKYQTP